VKAGPAVADFLGGTHLYAAIVTALFDRERTGVGRTVEIAMQDAMYPTMASNLSIFFENRDAQPRTGNRHGGLGMAPYNVYRASDGWVAIICVSEGHWKGVLEACGRTDLLGDPRYASHQTRAKVMDEVDAMVEAWSSTKTRAELQRLAQLHHFPCAPVRDLAEVTEDPHMHARGMLHKVHHRELGDVVLHHSPLRFSGADPLPLQPEPDLGEHTAQVLAEYVGVGPEEFERMKRDGAF
jgi:crotonobetainyl-CoA:carnitine CoA-transferase CaiB-like acyl-CoA transferase